MLIAERSQEYAAFARQQEATADAIRKKLPPGAVLFDFVEYHLIPLAEDGGKVRFRWEPHLLAFVIKRDQPLTVVNLGPAKPIRDLTLAWHGEIARRRGGVVSQGKPTDGLPQYELSKLVWSPLSKHAEGCEMILVSPDGSLASLPWACLPQADSHRYLVEDYSIVSVPVPRQLISEDRDEEVHEPSLCLVGGVDFGAAPGRTTVGDENESSVSRTAIRNGNLNFAPLPGTEREVKSIASFYRSTFPKAPLAQGVAEQATEDRVRVAARRFNHLHFATHGYFVSVEQADEFTSEHPGLLSGSALAGANRGAIDENSDDGILTALEVASLDLQHVELAVLSACETGLGKVVRGEGVLGLQRAFHIAGAETTVASLWKVDDDATVAVMSEFYRQMWEERAGKAASLRQTQLAMLNRFDLTSSKLQPRGLAVLPPEKTDSPSTGLPPYYWAAIVISGQWK